MLWILPDPAIGPSKIQPPIGAKHQASRFGFGNPLLGRPIGSHFARREIAEAHTHPESRMARNRAAEPDFEIVGVRTECKQIDHRVNENASSAASTSSR
jgi:hypothetical protein